MKQIEGIRTTQQHTTPSAPPSAPPKMGSGTAHSAADVAAVADQRTAEPRSVSTWIDTTLCTSPTSRDTISGHGLSGAEGQLLPRPVRDADSRDGVRDASRAYNRQDTSRPRHHRMPPEHIDAIDSVAHIGESNQNNALPTHMTIDMAENTDAKRQKTSRKGGKRTTHIYDFEQRDTRNAHTTAGLGSWMPQPSLTQHCRTKLLATTAFTRTPQHHRP